MKIFVATDCATAGRDAGVQLEARGYEIETGYIYGLDWGPGTVHPDEWIDMLRPDLDNCDGVALLDGWRDSPGACFEAGAAWGLGLKCRPLQYWLERPITRT